jgi:dihydrofolate reductase
VLGGAWSGPQYVITHNAPKDEEDASIKFLSGDIHGAVGVARDAAGGKNVMVMGANIARQCIQAGLMDEIRVHPAPVLLGDGVRFFNCRERNTPYVWRRLTQRAGDSLRTFISVW